MAHRHRHPEDQTFFRRLGELFHVLEDEGSQPTPGEDLPPLTSAASGRVHEDPTAACPPGVLPGGGALRDMADVADETKRGIAGRDDHDAARKKVASPSRSSSVVGDSTRAGFSSCEEATTFGIGERGAVATVVTTAAPVAGTDAGGGAGGGAAAIAAAFTPAAAPAAAPAASSVAPAAAAPARPAAARVAITADPEQERRASNGRAGKCDGADVRIFCIWSRRRQVRQPKYS